MKKELKRKENSYEESFNFSDVDSAGTDAGKLRRRQTQSQNAGYP